MSVINASSRFFGYVRFLFVLSIASAVLSLVPQVFGNPSYTLEELPGLSQRWGTASSFPRAVNDRGDVVGRSYCTDWYHSYYWSNGVITDLGTFGGLFSGAEDVNSTGAVVGGAYGDDSYNDAFLYSGGTVQNLGDGTAKTINDNGDILINRSILHDGTTYALPALSGWTAVYAIDMNGVRDAVGYGKNPGGANQAVVWNGYQMAALAMPDGYASSYGSAINDLGVAVGYAKTAGGTSRAVTWQNDTATILPIAAGYTDSQATGINGSGRVVGTAKNSSGQWRAVLWQDDQMIDLNECLPAGTTQTVAEVRDISDSGYILCGGSSRSYLLTPASAAPPSASAVPLSWSYSAATNAYASAEIEGIVDLAEDHDSGSDVPTDSRAWAQATAWVPDPIDPEGPPMEVMCDSFFWAKTNAGSGSAGASLATELIADTQNIGSGEAGGQGDATITGTLQVGTAEGIAAGETVILRISGGLTEVLNQSGWEDVLWSFNLYDDDPLQPLATINDGVHSIELLVEAGDVLNFTLSHSGQYPTLGAWSSYDFTSVRIDVIASPVPEPGSLVSAVFAIIGASLLHFRVCRGKRAFQ